MKVAEGMEGPFDTQYIKKEVQKMSKRKQSYYGNSTKRKREEKFYKRELAEAASDSSEEDLPIETIAEPKHGTNDIAWVSRDKQKWYVLDTNLILSCVDVIYDPDDPSWRPPLKFRPSLDNAHIIIPTMVFEELDHIKDEQSVNSSIARIAFRRLKRLFPNSERTLGEIMTLSRPISTGWKQQTISILPLHRNFVQSLPWVPSPDDQDGWIAATALAATMIRDGELVDGTKLIYDVLNRSNARKDVILLTNDNALLTKADFYGVRAKPYSFGERTPYTGLRELTVPAEMFAKFYHEEKLSREDFESYLPSEKPLVANEYIVMTPENDAYPRGYFAESTPFLNTARYCKQHDMLYPMRFMKREGDAPPNAGIATYYDAMNDDRISVIVVTGKAGTGKTYQIVRHAIRALKRGQYSKAILIVNANSGVGYLPGGPEKKIEPMIAFCKDAIRSYLAQTPEFRKRREFLRKHGDVDSRTYEMADAEDHARDSAQDSAGLSTQRVGRKRRKAKKPENNEQGTEELTYYDLLEEHVNDLYRRYFTAIPYIQAQGRTFEDAIVIVDEAQRIMIDDMDTFITRPGKNSLLVVCGDVDQIKHNSPEKRIKNGLIFTQRIYYDWEGCANIRLTDNMRHIAADVANRNYEKVIREIGALKI